MWGADKIADLAFLIADGVAERSPTIRKRWLRYRLTKLPGRIQDLGRKPSTRRRVKRLIRLKRALRGVRSELKAIEELEKEFGE